jgi:1-acyl-sn-glycerol-3-phosphate acyltransferase
MSVEFTTVVDNKRHPPPKMVEMIMKLLSYPRAFILSPLIGVYTLAMSALILLLANLGVRRDYLDNLIRYPWAHWVMWLANVEIDVRGAENIPADKTGFLVLFNHTSHIDIIALYGFLPKIVRFGAKIELFRVPFFGKAMLKMGAIPIDRRLREKVLQLYQAAIPRVAAGDAFALAPEGTRQKEPVLGKFKYGPFLFAVQAQMNIVPVVLAGAYEVLPKNSIWVNMGAWKRTVIMEILKPVSTAGLSDTDIEGLQNSIHEKMHQTLERLKVELLEAQTTFVKNR